MNEPLSIGDRVSWRGLNRTYSGKVAGEHPDGWIVRIDGSDKCILISKPKSRQGLRTG